MLALLIRRELLEHLISLRFSVLLMLTVVLMGVNAFGFAKGTYSFKRDRYIKNTAAEYTKVRTHANRGLRYLALRGPEKIYIKPSPLIFAAVGATYTLPDYVSAETSLSFHNNHFSVLYPWILHFPTSLDPDAQQLFLGLSLDWVFIVGVVLSLAALLFTFNAIIGEKEQGTLKLLMSHALTRHTLLGGKFCSTMLALTCILFLSLVINILLVLLLSDINISGVEWVRLVGLFFLSLIYLSVFTAIGLLVSIVSDSARSSLVAVLLLWTVGVLVWPEIGGSIAARLAHVSSAIETEHRFNHDFPINRKVGNVINTLSRNPRDQRNPEKIRELSQVMREWRQTHQALSNSGLSERLGQVEVGRHLTRLSPMGCFKYSMEALAGTGLARYLSFVAQVRTYGQQFEQTVLALDQNDPRSMHIPLVKEGLSSKKVDPNIIPVFEENISASTLARQGLLDVGGLFFFAVLSYMLAYLSWLRSSIL